MELERLCLSLNKVAKMFSIKDIVYSVEA